MNTYLYINGERTGLMAGDKVVCDDESKVVIYYRKDERMYIGDEHGRCLDDHFSIRPTSMSDFLTYLQLLTGLTARKQYAEDSITTWVLTE